MSADIWRAPVSVVKTVGKCSFVQDRGMLTSAQPSSGTGNWLFSELGAGTRPLVLVGMWHEALSWMAERESRGIENRLEDLPDVYMGSCFYRPGKRFKGLFPMHDSIQALTEGFAGLGAGGIGNAFGGGASATVNSIGGIVADGTAIKRSFFGKKKVVAPTIATNPVAITFSYMESNGLSQIGTGTVLFEDIYSFAANALLDMAGG